MDDLGAGIVPGPAGQLQLTRSREQANGLTHGGTIDLIERALMSPLCRSFVLTVPLNDAFARGFLLISVAYIVQSFEKNLEPSWPLCS
jgi:hypothetical protein